MMRTVAALFAAFTLVGLDAFAQGSAESTKQTETKSDTVQNGKKTTKKHKKMKKAKKSDGSMSKSTTTESKTEATPPK